MATHSSVLAWRIPWTEGPGGLQSLGLQRVRHDWAINTHVHTLWLYLLSFMSQPKERRHDTHEYFIILILVDLLLHLNYSLPLVLWHDILLLLFLPSQFPLLILLPLPGLSPKCHALSSSMSLGHVRDFWGPRDEPCVLINPKGMFTAPISSLSSGLLNPTASLPSLLELTEMKPLPPRGIRAQNRNTGTEKALLVHLELVPILLAVSDLLSPILWFH